LEEKSAEFRIVGVRGYQVDYLDADVDVPDGTGIIANFEEIFTPKPVKKRLFAESLNIGIIQRKAFGAIGQRVRLFLQELGQQGLGAIGPAVDVQIKRPSLSDYLYLPAVFHWGTPQVQRRLLKLYYPDADMSSHLIRFSKHVIACEIHENGSCVASASSSVCHFINAGANLKYSHAVSRVVAQCFHPFRCRQSQ
jgi:hypothetical protein